MSDALGLLGESATCSEDKKDWEEGPKMLCGRCDVGDSRHRSDWFRGG